MIEGLFSGILLGLTMAIMLGPALFSLLQTSIHRGFRSGMFLAIGIMISDFVLVALSYLGVSAIFTKSGNNMVFGIIGGAIMILFGIFTFRKKAPKNTELKDLEGLAAQTRKPWKYMAKGFILNFANPFLIIFWMGWMAYAGNNWGHKSLQTLFFFGGTLTTIFATDLLKCFIAGRIKKYLRPRLIMIVNYILGAILIILGIYMILRVTVFESKGKKIGTNIERKFESVTDSVLKKHPTKPLP